MHWGEARMLNTAAQRGTKWKSLEILVSVTLVVKIVKIRRSCLAPVLYASVNRICIDSDNGLSPIRRQAII